MATPGLEAGVAARPSGAHRWALATGFGSFDRYSSIAAELSRSGWMLVTRWSSAQSPGTTESRREAEFQVPRGRRRPARRLKPRQPHRAGTGSLDPPSSSCRASQMPGTSFLEPTDNPRRRSTLLFLTGSSAADRPVPPTPPAFQRDAGLRLLADIRGSPLKELPVVIWSVLGADDSKVSDDPKVDYVSNVNDRLLSTAACAACWRLPIATFHRFPRPWSRDEQAPENKLLRLAAAIGALRVDRRLLDGRSFVALARRSFLKKRLSRSSTSLFRQLLPFSTPFRMSPSRVQVLVSWHQEHKSRWSAVGTPPLSLRSRGCFSAAGPGFVALKCFPLPPSL